MPVRGPRSRRLEPGRLWLADTVMDRLTENADRKTPLETGGVLLGYGVNDDDVVVVDMIGPGPGATHRPNRFEPDTRWQRNQIAEAYERSGRVHRYLGDWHSHPGGSARPSRRDERTARRIARHRPTQARRPVMVILSGRDDYWRPTGYRLLRGKLVEMKLKIPPA